MKESQVKRLQVKALESFCVRLANSQEFNFIAGKTHTYALRNETTFKELLENVLLAEEKGKVTILLPKQKTESNNPKETKDTKETKPVKRSKK